MDEEESAPDQAGRLQAAPRTLLPARRSRDAGPVEKFTRYQKWNPTLSDSLLVSKDQPQIEHYHRQADGGWSYRRYTGLEATVAIPSIKCTLKLAEVYDRVTFSEEG